MAFASINSQNSN